MFFDDLRDVFYNAESGARLFSITGAVPPVTFYALVGEVGREVLQDIAVANVVTMRYATATAPSLADGALLTSGAQSWRVMGPPLRVNTGSESECFIAPA